jgi:hypothetical protein
LPGGVEASPDVFRFTFGNFSAPVAVSRFVLLSPENVKLNLVPNGNVPDLQQELHDSMVTRIWQAENLPRYATEVSMPGEGVLASIRVFAELDGGWQTVRDFYRDEFIEASHIGSRVDALANTIPAGTDEQRLRAAYRLVTSRVRSSDDDYSCGNIDTAEDTLTGFNGSRTAVLLALARALGISGEVLMARHISPLPPSVPSAHAYSHPLLLFHLKSADGPDHDFVLDAETDGIGFGGIASAIDLRDALLVPVEHTDSARLIAPVPAPIADDHSVADGDVTFDQAGNLSAHVVIRMGATRGAQIRSTLSGIDPTDRKHYFEQLASRIFPGVTEATGEVQNENDPNNPLILAVDCRANGFADFSTGDLGQLVPALGLRSMYATSGGRFTPLYVDTPLIETSTFRIHLPSGMAFANPPRDFSERSDFGSYSVSFRLLGPTSIEVRRDFDVPAQLVEAAKFNSFARFANDVDNSEKLKLGLLNANTAAALRKSAN